MNLQLRTGSSFQSGGHSRKHCDMACCLHQERRLKPPLSPLFFIAAHSCSCARSKLFGLKIFLLFFFFLLLYSGSFEPKSFQSCGSESDTTNGCNVTTEELAHSTVKVEKVARSRATTPLGCIARDKSG